MTRNRSRADAARDVRVGEILNQFLDARARGERVCEAALLARHPDLADDLRDHLKLLGELPRPADHIDDLIARSILKPYKEPLPADHSHRYLA